MLTTKKKANEIHHGHRLFRDGKVYEITRIEGFGEADRCDFVEVEAFHGDPLHDQDHLLEEFEAEQEVEVVGCDHDFGAPDHGQRRRELRQVEIDVEVYLDLFGEKPDVEGDVVSIVVCDRCDPTVDSTSLPDSGARSDAERRGFDGGRVAALECPDCGTAMHVPSAPACNAWADERTSEASVAIDALYDRLLDVTVGDRMTGAEILVANAKLYEYALGYKVDGGPLRAAWDSTPAEHREDGLRFLRSLMRDTIDNLDHRPAMADELKG